MMMRRIALATLSMLAVPVLYAHQTLKTLTLSPDFSEVAGTPRMATDTTQRQWAVAWLQYGSPVKIMGRIVKPDGSLKPPKLLASSVEEFEQNFDLAYGFVDRTYLLVFENAAGLQVQRLTKDLARKGKPILIEAGTEGVNPRMVYDPTGNRFLVIWIGNQDGSERNALRGAVLASTGVPTEPAHTLALAAKGRALAIPSVVRNEETNNFTVLVVEKTGTAGRFLGFTARPDGSLLRSTPIQFQGMTPGLSAIGASAYSESGFGFAAWLDRGKLKYRKVSPTGGLASGIKTVANAADSSSSEVSFVYDGSHDEFVGVWTKANGAYAAGLAEASGKVSDAPFQIAASALSQSLHPALSIDQTSGRLFAIWEDSQAASRSAIAAATKYRVRAALFAREAQGAVVDVSGEDNVFAPSTVNISPGDTVRWTMTGNNPHTVTSGTPSSSPGTLFDSGTLTKGQTFQFQFTTPGTYPYFCRIHGAMMSGTVVVGGGPSTKQVSIGDGSFAPASISVAAGSTVTWKMSSTMQHTVTSGSPSSSPGALFDSGTLKSGDVFSFRFTDAGTYTYYCRLHGDGMSGTVEVTSYDGGGDPY
ncbi:MAG: plastocyanin/azurin family copper-binding protein [Acidobacteriota bacterium]